MSNRPGDAPRTRLPAKGPLVGLLLLIVAVAVATLALLSTDSSSACGLCHNQGRPSAGAGRGHNVECWKCHDAIGSLAAARRPLRLSRMILGRVFGRKPLTADIDTTRCLACHSKELGKPLTARNLRVSHSDFIDDIGCPECHGVHRQRNELVLDRCAVCHNETGESTSCRICHVGDIPSPRKASGWLLSVHDGGAKGHGGGSYASCGLCHPKKYCATCHKIPVPHESDWPATHGESAKRNPKSCVQCHEPKVCDDCHRVPMPHKTGFLMIHWPLTKHYGRDVCLNCHQDQDCLACHLRHIHPAVFKAR